MVHDEPVVGDEVLVIAPVAARAALWTLLGATAIGCAGWALAATTARSVVAIAGGVLIASLATTAAFAVQLFAPAAWTLRLGAGRLRGYASGRPVDVALADCTVLELGRVLGDAALVVETRWGRRRLLLPVGADLPAIDRAIAGIVARHDRRGADPA